MQRTTLLAGALGASVLLLGLQVTWNSGLLTEPLAVSSYLSSGVFFYAPATGTAFEKETEGFVYIGVTGNYIDDRVYSYGLYERPELYALRDILTTLHDDRGVFLDIGANVGQHSLFMAQHAGTVHAVEPFPLVLKRFDEMLTRNGFDNVVVHRVGFSNEPGSLPFFAPPDDNLGTGSFDGSFRDYNTRATELPLVVGDDWLEAKSIDQIDLIKVDIEGFERYALEGLQRTLTASRPVIAMELNPSEGGFSSQAQLDATLPPDYGCFEVEQPTQRSLYWLSFTVVRYMYGPNVTGEYVIRPFNQDFETQRNILCMPDTTAGTLRDAGLFD